MKNHISIELFSNFAITFKINKIMKTISKISIFLVFVVICSNIKAQEDGKNPYDVNFKIDERTNRIIMMGAIDNVVKGAAGQAVQNMNIMFGLDENTGLKLVPMFP